MPVLLRHARDLPPAGKWDLWVAIGPAPGGLDPVRRRAGVPGALETAFDAVAPLWWQIGKALAADPSAGLAHTPACVANASDFGLMLAWAKLIERWGGEATTTLAVCDDPWLFRHLAAQANVKAGPAPALWPAAVRLRLRGVLARGAYALRAAAAALKLAPQRRTHPAGRPSLLVYGHPRSTVDGDDAYFGPLLRELPDVVRLLHVDCRPGRALALAGAGRTASLHAFGSAPFALARLPFARWRPSASHRRGPQGWLVRRAAAREGATAQGAAILWQRHCQARWLAAARPPVVAWPWENHAWERALVREAGRLGLATAGYQHSVIGRQMLNYAPASNPDGPASLPGRVLCSGSATRDQLLAWGVPAERLAVAGALRFPALPQVARDPAAPVFVALPFDGAVAAEMVAALRPLGQHGRRFLVKDHPMTPYDFADSPGVARTGRPLGQHPALAGVVYAATTVGLEALLAGLPAIRFQPRGRIAIDILPAGIATPAADAESLEQALATMPPPPPLAPERVFAPVDNALWADVLRGGAT